MKLILVRRIQFKVIFLVVSGMPFLMSSCNTGTTTQKSKIIYAKDFGLIPGEEVVPALREALEAGIMQQATKLVIPEGKYDCY